MFLPYLPEGIDYVLNNVRNVYTAEESNVFVFLDNEYKIQDRITDTRRLDLFLSIAKKYDVNIMISDNRFTYATVNFPEEGKLKMIELINRIIFACENSKSKWLCILEDDVLVRKKITKFPNTDFTVASGQLCTGGIIYNREKILNALKSYSSQELFEQMNGFALYFAGDRLVKNLLLNRGLTCSVFEDHADGIRPENTDAAIIHGIKDHYPPYYIEYRKYMESEIENNPMPFN
jgi:hypothetical protein